MRHGPKDMTRHGRVVSLCGKLYRYGEVVLGDEVLRVIESRPTRKVGELAGRSEHVFSHSFVGVASTQVTRDIRSQVLDESRASVPASAPLVDTREDRCHLANGLKITATEPAEGGVASGCRERLVALLHAVEVRGELAGIR